MVLSNQREALVLLGGVQKTLMRWFIEVVGTKVKAKPFTLNIFSLAKDRTAGRDGS